MIVQYHGHHDVVAEFDPDSGELTAMPRPADLPITSTQGWFAILDGVCVVFFRHADCLWLRLGNRVFNLDCEPRVEWSRDGGVSVLAVADERGEVVLRYRGGPPSGPALDQDPTAFTQSEDWDLGLFVANVIFDEERAELLRRGAS